MRPPENISPQQLIGVVDPRPVEPKAWDTVRNTLSPFSPPRRTTTKDLASCAEIVDTAKSLALPPHKFDALYKGATVVDGITFAWDGTQTVIHDTASPDETDFLENLQPFASNRSSLPSETDLPRVFSFFDRDAALEATPITHTRLQKTGRLAIAGTAGALGFEVTELGLGATELQTISEGAVTGSSGIIAAACVVASLRLQRRRERKALVAAAKAQVAGLDERVHNPKGGIVFPRDSGIVRVGADKNRIWKDIYELDFSENSGRIHIVNPVLMIYTALKADSNPKEFWGQTIGSKSLRDYTQELADLCQRRQHTFIELDRLQRLGKATGISPLPADVATRENEIAAYQKQMDEIAEQITELVIIRQEQQGYIQEAASSFQSILTTSEQNQLAIERFAGCLPPKGSPMAGELLTAREKLSQAINVDILFRPGGAQDQSTARTLNRLAEYMETHEPEIRDAAGFDIYCRALHSKFVAELPSLSALFGLPGPENPAKESVKRESEVLATLFGEGTKVCILDGLVCATTKTKLTIYDSIDMAHQAANQEESSLGISVTLGTPKGPTDRIGFIHIPVDKMDELGIGEDDLLQLFGKEHSRNTDCISYTTHDFITRVLRKVDDAQIFWASGFNASVQKLSECYDAARADTERRDGQVYGGNYEATFPLGLDLVRSYLAYIQPKNRHLETPTRLV
ncbi:hypothetical protein EYC59_02785 [Candidatus Saccharibacteria bacterium]|nr:MAG: hypothetical protein EYC59_02785 [Candidatus Saccharibacteria bacterium]